MHVIWKRPDGFHNAEPTDFEVIELQSHGRIWLHKRDQAWFPFRIAGGWQESEATMRLNMLVNLLAKADDAWLQALHRIYDQTMGDDPHKFIEEMLRWLRDLHGHLKGDTWEVEIMNQALSDVEGRLLALQPRFTSPKP